MPGRTPYYRPAGTASRSSSEAERLAFYNSTPWRKLRAAFLRANPLCKKCSASGQVVEATTVHHVEERLKRPDLAFAWSNLEPLCSACHTRYHKTRGGP